MYVCVWSNVMLLSPRIAPTHMVAEHVLSWLAISILAGHDMSYHIG